MINKKTTKRVWEAAKELKISSKEMMKLANKHHWFCAISIEELEGIKNKLQGGKGMKIRREIKPDEMMRVFKEGGSFVLTLEGVERFGIKGRKEYHLNGKKVITTYDTDEENVQYLIDMVNAECYEGWQVWEVLESQSEEKLAENKEYIHAAHILSIDDDAMWDRLSAYLFQDKNGFIYSKKNNKMLTQDELTTAINWVNRRA